MWVKGPLKNKSQKPLQHFRVKEEWFKMQTRWMKSCICHNVIYFWGYVDDILFCQDMKFASLRKGMIDHSQNIE